MKKKILVKPATVKSEKPTVSSDYHVLSIEEYKYFQSALKYAKERGFKTVIFNENGKIIALQG